MATPYLVKRRAGWYIRLRTPADLRSVIGDHVVRSLRTTDLSVARGRALMAAAGMPAVWRAMRDEAVRILGKDIDDLTAEDVVDCDRDRLRADIDTLGNDDRHRLRARLTTILTEQSDAIHHARIDRTTAQIVADAMADARKQGIIEGLERAMRIPAAVAAPASEQPPPNPKTRMMWHAEVVPAFFATKGFAESARVSNERAFRECVNLIGDRPISDLAAADIRRYRDWLVAKPGKKAGTFYAHQSIVKDLGHIKSFLAWAVGEDYLAASPAEKVKAPEAKSAAAKRDLGIRDEDRRAYTVAELKTIFDSPLYTGCHSRWHHRDPGPNIYREDRYYFLLAMLLTGARHEELAGAPAEFYDLDGIPCLDLLRVAVKSDAAPRIIPIQAALRRTGFLRFAADKARAGLKLFGGDHAPTDWSKWTNRYIDDIGVDDVTVVAYSLRHNFRQSLRSANLHIETTNRIFGHAGEGVGPDYGPTLTAPEARNYLAAIKPAVPLDHLYIAD